MLRQSDDLQINEKNMNQISKRKSWLFDCKDTDEVLTSGASPGGPGLPGIPGVPGDPGNPTSPGRPGDPGAPVSP